MYRKTFIAFALVLVLGGVFLTVTMTSAGGGLLGLSNNTASSANGLAGYWPLDGNTINWATGVVGDSSGQGNVGQLVGMSTTTSPTAGKVGEALSFNGSNYVSLPSAAFGSYPTSGNTPTYTITFSSWFKTSVGGSILGQTSACSPPTSCSSYVPALYIDTTGKIRASLFWHGATADQIVTSGTYTDNKWHQVVDTYTNGVETLYVDGAEIGSQTANENGYTTTYYYLLGTSYGGSWPNAGGSWYYFNGSLDDARTYNRALSPQEVQQLYGTGEANAAHSGTSFDSSGLVAYWSMDGSTINWLTGKVSDVSGNGNTGQLINMSTSTSPAAGKVGEALTFSKGSQYINISSAASLNTTSVTVSAWVKPSTNSASIQIIAEHYDGVNVGYNIFLQNREICTYYGNSLTCGATVVPVGTWTHAVVTADGTTVRIFVNGSLDGSAVRAATPVTAGITIGARSINSFPFAGLIDDVRVYNRALSAQEVQQLYASGQVNIAHSNTNLNPSGLVGYWTFDGPRINWATGAVADSSGNGNTGHLVNMSTSTSPAPGKVGQALSFNGTSQTVAIPDAASLDSPQVTVSGWIRPSDLTTPAYPAIVDKSGGHSQQYIFVYKYGAAGSFSNQLRVIIYIGGVRNDCSVVGGLAINVWDYLAFTYDGSAVRIYQNGSLLGTCFVSGSITTGTSQMFIGYDQSYGYAAGKIDDVRVYNRALSAQEIQQLYSAGR